MAVRLIFFIFLLTSLMSCSHNRQDYQNTTPKFDIKEYFQGRVLAWGTVQDFTDKVTRRFCVEIDASWQNNKGVLAETFYFDDGEVSYRNWQLVKLAEGKYQGTAEDVVGVAYGQHAGFAFHWQYSLQVPIEDEVYTFTLDDWMYQLDDKRVLNKTKMKKLGVTVANITLFFEKSSASLTCQRN